MTKAAIIEKWVRLISDEEMPAFAHTASHAAGISANSDSSTADLARVVLMDSAMTTRVLRLANSVYYNPTAHRVATVSRAIVLLGFETMRTIALSIAMIDTMLRGKRQDRVVAEMALAFHAAVQAKSLAGKCGEPAAEEVFIAALLKRLGAMAFWCFPNSLDEKLEAALNEYDKPADAERAVLGFTLDELSGALNEEWNLSELLGQILDGRQDNQPRVQFVKIAHQIAAGAAQRGWDAPETKRCITLAGKLTNLPEQEITQLVHANTRQAVHAAVEYGTAGASQLIPLPRLEDSAGLADAVQDEQPGDPGFQLRILRELSAMLSERVDINALLGMVLEGIYRGVALDRAVLALLSLDGSRLKAKYALGEKSESLLAGFDFPVAANSPNLFSQVLATREPLWLSQGGQRWSKLRTPDIAQRLGNSDCFLFPLTVGGRPGGLFYADCHASGRALDERSFDAFRHFCEQAVIGLSVLGIRPS